MSLLCQGEEGTDISVTTLKGAFGLGPQVAKGTAGTTYYWYPVFNSDYGVVNDERPFPQEVRGLLWPTGAYRAGFFAAGGIDFAPRLFDDFMWILIAALGENPVTSVDTPVVGVNRHRWTIDGSEDVLPWSTVHLIVPGATADLGIIGLDNRAAMMRFQLPQSGYLTGRLDLLGRLATDITNTIFVESPSGAGWTTSFEDFTTVPVSAKGGVIVAGLNGGAEIPVTGWTIEVANGLTTPQQEMRIGSYFPDDFTAIAKTVTVRTILKWDEADIYQTIITGTAAGTALTESTFEGQATIEVQAPGNITGTTPYELEIVAPNVLWQISNPRLAGAGLLQVELTGTVIKLGTDNVLQVDAFTGEGDAGYAWPT